MKMSKYKFMILQKDDRSAIFRKIFILNLKNFTFKVIL